jgi:hypothetical protein
MPTSRTWCGFDLSTVSKEELAVNLGRILEELRQPGKPTLIDDSAERTQSVIADLKLLADLPDDEFKNEIIWYSGGFPSSFSMGEVKAFRDDDQPYQDA